MILDSFKLDGKVALVTGGAQGLGQGLALGLAEAGADVAVLDQRPPDDTYGAITALGRRTQAITYDLQGTTPESARSVIEGCVAQMGRLDILVNNAGIIRRGPALEFTADDWEAVLGIDLSSVFYLSQAAARHFVAAGQRGKIVNVASMLSFQGGILVPSYAAAKSGIAPGYMATEVTAAIRDDPARSAAMLARTPAGRWGEPADLKGTVVFLASDAACYVHGSIVPVDGGWLA